MSWTPEQRKEMLAHTQRVATYGEQPAGPITGPPAGVSVAADDEGEIFSEADLLVQPFEPFRYTMPNGRVLWIHAVSPDEAIWLNANALREVKALRLDDENEAHLQRRFRAQIYQAICVCRKGPAPDAPHVFKPESAETLRRNKGWLGAVQDIVAISDRLSRSEEDETKKALVDFFGSTASWAKTFASRLTMGSPDCSALAQIAESFAACASSIAQRGRLRANEAEQLPPLE
jgi:hypothetical protein